MKMNKDEFRGMIKNRDYNKINALIESGTKFPIREVFPILYVIYRREPFGMKMFKSISQIIRIDQDTYSYLIGGYLKSNEPALDLTVLYLTKFLLRDPETKSEYLDKPLEVSIHMGERDDFKMMFMLIEGGANIYSGRHIFNIVNLAGLDVIKRLDKIQPIKFDFVAMRFGEEETLLKSWISGNLWRGEDPKEGILYLLNRGAPIKGSIDGLYFTLDPEIDSLISKTIQILQALGESVYNKNKYDKLKTDVDEAIDFYNPEIGDAGEEDHEVYIVLRVYFGYQMLVDNYSTASLKSITLATIDLNDGDLSLLPRSYYYQRPPFPLITMKHIEDKVYQEIDRIHSQN